MQDNILEVGWLLPWQCCFLELKPTTHPRIAMAHYSQINKFISTLYTYKYIVMYLSMEQCYIKLCCSLHMSASTAP